MTNDHLKQMQEIFHASLEHEGATRASYLQQACADDPELQREIEALLAAHEEPTSFLAAPDIERLPAGETTIPKPTAPLPGAISHYETLSLLGKGGMGEVYLASDTSLGRKVALKILPARYTTEPDLVHRFEREAKAASALNHPNILTVYEIGKTADSHFIATEFIEGETLRQRLARGNLALKEALDIATQIAAALTAAHEAGIIHRDIKPENIMLRPDGYVKVLDFGLAKLTESAYNPDESTTQTGLIMGTPSYMSPEQARGQKVDFRTDIWSIGVVLHEMVSGARPFRGNTQADLMVEILERAPKPLPEHLPAELRAIVQRTLSKDPHQRGVTTKELHDDLKALHRQVEFAAEFTPRVAPNDDEEVTLRQTLEADTLPLTPQLATEAVIVPPVAPLALPPKRFAIRTVVTALVLGSALSLTGWYFFKANPVVPTALPIAAAPKRALTWWLTAQRMLNGKLEDKQFQSAGRDWFPNGSKVKFNLVSPQAGYLYLLNEGLTKGGEISLNLLYPTPANGKGNAAVAAQQPIQTGNNNFDEHEGEEKFWIVWAAQPVAAIEAAKGAAFERAKTTGLPEINPPSQRAAIRNLLNQQLPQSTAKSDESKEQTSVTSTSDIAVSFVKLRHR